MGDNGYQRNPNSMTFTSADNVINLLTTDLPSELKQAWQTANGKEWPYENPDQLVNDLMQDFLSQRGYQSHPSNNPSLFVKNTTTTTPHSTNATITLNLEDELADPILAEEWRSLYGVPYTNGVARLRKRRHLELELATRIGKVIKAFHLPPSVLTRT
jgi:hypothetical protein